MLSLYKLLFYEAQRLCDNPVVLQIVPAHSLFFLFVEKCKWAENPLFFFRLRVVYSHAACIVYKQAWKEDAVYLSADLVSLCYFFWLRVC